MSTDPMAEIRATFFAECEELLEALEDSLRQLDEGRHDKETINAVFRAVHSIKGGAGAFGLDHLVRFAHCFETALDELRSGKIAPEPANVATFFRSADYLADLVEQARGGELRNPEVEVTLLEQLVQMTEAGEGGGAAAAEEEAFVFEPISFDFGAIDEGPEPATVTGNRFRISFTPFADFFASGNDPLFILRALGDLGPVAVTCHADMLQPFDKIDPQQCYIRWTVMLTTLSGLADVIDTSAFVEGLCDFEVEDLGGGEPPPEQPTSPDTEPDAETEPADRGTPSAAGGDADDTMADAGQAATMASALVPAPAARPAPASPRAAKADAPADRRDPPSDGSRETRPTVRVDLDRIDRLVNLVGELVINQSMLSQEIFAAGLATNSSTAMRLEEFLHLSRNIQESVMMIRAQPIKPLFSRMARIVRETSSDTGKQVHMRTEGENTEIDKTVVERLAEPLTHMIRNAIDHGLEKTEDRISAGKPVEGVVTLSASHRSGRVVIEVSDDGAGINRPRVLETAIRKGLVSADQSLSDGDIDNLLFLPGFSTAATVSNLSGRGVGMDVVKNAVNEIGGRISISSERGKGTTFSISLPLTLAVLDGMVVQVTNEKIVVPLSAIIETLSVNKGDISVIGANNRIVRIRDGFVPLLDLGVELGYRSVPVPDGTGVILLITEDNGNRVAIIVDKIEDQRQVVIKGIEKNYGRVPGIAAATILGDGNIALILDPADFVDMASGYSRNSRGSMALAG